MRIMREGKQMRKDIRVILLVGMLIISAFGLSACGKKVADEEQIKQELETNVEFQFLKEGEQIEEIVIEKRQTEKEQKTDTVWCTVVTNDAEISCQKNIILSYGLYDKAGWQLDDIEIESKKDWIMMPLKGVDESAVLTLLAGQVIVIDKEEWLITQENLLKVEIENQQTNLEQKTDQLTVSLVLDDKLERAEGKVEVLFTFDQEWQYDSVISMDDFAVSMKEEYSLNVSEDDLMAKVIEAELPVGETKQTISVEKEEISDFRIDEQKAGSKGSRQIYQCSYRVNKSQVALEMKTAIIYTYQDGNGWSGSVNKTESKVVSADIEGNWGGTYIDGFSKEKAELHISEVKDDGTVTATYSFASGSYELSGTWNQESLELYLDAGEWIVEPEKIRVSNDKDKITGELKLEKDRLEANTQQGFIYFVVTEN